MERLKSFDFVNTEYGRGRIKNKFKKIDNHYTAFLAEDERFVFLIADGLIDMIIYVPTDDANPYDKNHIQYSEKAKRNRAVMSFQN